MIHFKCIVDVVVVVNVAAAVIVDVVVVAVSVDILPFFLLSTEANNNIFLLRNQPSKFNFSSMNDSSL